MVVLYGHTILNVHSCGHIGDAVSSGAIGCRSTAAEDEKDLSRVSGSMELYEAYVKGFLKGCGGRLTAPNGPVDCATERTAKSVGIAAMSKEINGIKMRFLSMRNLL